jgi:hypothetical protein
MDIIEASHVIELDRQAIVVEAESHANIATHPVQKDRKSAAVLQGGIEVPVKGPADGEQDTDVLDLGEAPGKDKHKASIL